jgi:hypothetical protein
MIRWQPLLALFFSQLNDWGLSSATNSVALPKPKPRAMCERFVVPSIGSRDVACAEWPDIRRFEHFLQLLNLVNDAFNVHASQSSKRRRGAVNLKQQPARNSSLFDQIDGKPSPGNRSHGEIVA